MLNYKFKNNNFQKGQALLIVVLVMVVALTVGLSILVRTTSNIRTSSEDENSQRAFSAAEAGIEQSLVSGSGVPSTNLANNTSYQTSISTVSGSGFSVNNGTVILKDDPVDVWLSAYPSYTSPWSGNITVNWGSSSDACNPNESGNTQAALELIVVSGTTVSPKIAEYAFDPCSSRISSNNFQLPTLPGDNVSGQNYAYKTSVTVTSGLIMRIIPLYAPTGIGIEADVPLPSQGAIVSAVGVSDDTQRKIISYKGFPKLPIELFPFIAFSPK